MNYKRRIYISVSFILGLVAAMICWLRGSKSGEFRLGPLDSHENKGNLGRGVFSSWRKRALEAKKHRNTPSAREKRGADSKKDLQICGAGGKSRKRPTLFVGEKSNGKFRMNDILTAKPSLR
jgi:hypothetical protein